MQITKIVCMLGVLLLNTNANGMTHEHLEPEYISFTEEEAYVLNTCNHNYFPTSTDTIKAQTNYPIFTIKSEAMRTVLSSFDQKQRNHFKRTGLVCATFKNWYNIALALLYLGYDVNECSWRKRGKEPGQMHRFQVAALVEAVQHKRMNFVQLFLQWDADPKRFMMRDGSNLLLFLAKKHNDLTTLTLLEEAITLRATYPFPEYRSETFQPLPYQHPQSAPAYFSRAKKPPPPYHPSTMQNRPPPAYQRPPPYGSRAFAEIKNCHGAAEDAVIW